MPKRNFVFNLFCLILPLFSIAQSRYDIVITECLPDPLPTLGLPGSEFVELKNCSTRDYNLHNWKIANGNSSATIKANYILKADSFLIICPAASSDEYGQFGATIGVSSFPSFNNDEDDIVLSTDLGLVIHAIHYDKSWYENELKAKGGWSLEMIDISRPCSGKENWTSSISISGGTPGHKNSVDAKNPDDQSPSLIQAIAKDSQNLILLFDEPVDSSSGAFLSNYTISDNINSPDTAIGLSPFFNQVAIHLKTPLVPGKIYTVSTQNILDCSGNEIGLDNTCKTGIAERAKIGDIIFNEILFNPPPYGYDYLELFNRSSRITRCSELFLSGKNNDGSLKDPLPIAKDERVFFPGEYLLLTENPEWVLQNYPMAVKSQMLTFTNMPSLPDDQGKVVLLNSSGESLDELDYDHHWHSALLTDETGVSLERIRQDQPTNIASNWTSAAATAGYGTPGYKNSESYSDSNDNYQISVEPKIFSPDLDGYQDFCFIHYHLPATGYMGSIWIFDVSGRKICTLANNVLWSVSGTFRWDGLDDQQNLLPTGHYIIYVELFLPDGTVRNQKLVCVLARKH
jgi:Lamin Tail Domain